ncbi:MAG: 50S ribosomal protein L24 [Clostridiaceae bacterium]
MKMHVKKSDKVVVISGNDKDTKSEILAVNPKKGTVIVKDVNIITKHQKATKANVNSGIVKKEAPIHSSKVMLWCSSCNKGVRPSYKYNDDGAKVRYCKACGKDL